MRKPSPHCSENVTSEVERDSGSRKNGTASARTRRYAVMRSPASAITIKDAAFEVMQEAYMKASAGGKLPAPARMVFYAALGR